MKAILLAGGYATRLWPITKSLPKPLLPLGEKTVADYIVEEVEEIDSISEVIISTNARFKQEFEDWIKEKSYSKTRVEVERTFSEKEKLGTIGALSQFTGEIDESVLVVAGDNYFPFDFRDFIDYFTDKKSSVIAVQKLERREKAKQYGVVELSRNDVVTSFVEKPKDPPSSTVSVACYLFPPSHFKMIDTYLERGGNPDEPGRFIEWLYNEVSVYGFKFTDKGFDIGTPPAYIEAFRELTPETSISKDAKVGDSVKIHDPVLVQGDAKISGEGEVGPYVHIQPGVDLVSSSVSNSIVFEDSKIEEANLKWSIVGKKTRIKRLNLRKSIIGSYTHAQS